MSVSSEQVRHIAKLARIAHERCARSSALVPELNNILGWVEQLGEVNTDGVEPLAAVDRPEAPPARRRRQRRRHPRRGARQRARGAARLLRRAEGDRIVTELTSKTIAELRDGFRAASSARARSPRASTPPLPARKALNAYTVETPEDALAAAEAAGQGARHRASCPRSPASRSASRTCSRPRASTPPPAAASSRASSRPTKAPSPPTSARRGRGCSASSTWTSSRWARRTKPAPTARSSARGGARAATSA